MKNYVAKFVGRRINAIGIFHEIIATVSADDKEKARIRLYDRFDHIAGLELIETLEKENRAHGI